MHSSNCWILTDSTVMFSSYFFVWNSDYQKWNEEGWLARLVGGVTSSTKHSISDLSLTSCNCILILTHKCMRGEIWIIVFALQCDILDSIFIFRNINTFGLYNKGIKMIQGVTYNWFILPRNNLFLLHD